MTVTPEPGDFCVCDAGGLVGRLIGFAELLNGAGALARYEHAFLYTGNGKIIQAEPGGAKERPLTHRALELWSTGVIPLTDPQRHAIIQAARGYLGVPYSFLDYAALAAHRLRLPVPGLRDFVADSRHQICSQLIDQCWADAGVHLFQDGRWAGYCTPAALAGRIEGGRPVT